MPARLLGRVNSAIRFAGLIAMFAGTLLGGGIATVFDARAAIILGGCVMFGGAAVLFLSPVRKLRVPPSTDPQELVVPATVA